MGIIGLREDTGEKLMERHLGIKELVALVVMSILSFSWIVINTYNTSLIGSDNPYFTYSFDPDDVDIDKIILGTKLMYSDISKWMLDSWAYCYGIPTSLSALTIIYTAHRLRTFNNSFIMLGYVSLASIVSIWGVNVSLANIFERAPIVARIIS